MDAQRERECLVAAGNLVETLGEDFEQWVELIASKRPTRRPRLARWVEAMAAYKGLLAKGNMLERLAQPPAGVTEHRRDAWQRAVEVFPAADTAPERAVATPVEVTELPDFAIPVARRLRREIK
jgi:hypothetical protein